MSISDISCGVRAAAKPPGALRAFGGQYREDFTLLSALFYTVRQ